MFLLCNSNEESVNYIFPLQKECQRYSSDYGTKTTMQNMALLKTGIIIQIILVLRVGKNKSKIRAAGSRALGVAPRDIQSNNQSIDRSIHPSNGKQLHRATVLPSPAWPLSPFIYISTSTGWRESQDHALPTPGGYPCSPCFRGRKRLLWEWQRYQKWRLRRWWRRRRQHERWEYARRQEESGRLGVRQPRVRQLVLLLPQEVQPLRHWEGWYPCASASCDQGPGRKRWRWRGAEFTQAEAAARVS